MNLALSGLCSASRFKSSCGAGATFNAWRSQGSRMSHRACGNIVCVPNMNRRPARVGDKFVLLGELLIEQRIANSARIRNVEHAPGMQMADLSVVVPEFVRVKLVRTHRNPWPGEDFLFELREAGTHRRNLRGLPRFWCPWEMSRFQFSSRVPRGCGRCGDRDRESRDLESGSGTSAKEEDSRSMTAEEGDAARR